jgi:hypothetical protein
MAIHSDNCLVLVKRFCRRQRQQTLSPEEERENIQTLLDRINAGTADRRLIPYLNRLTATAPACNPNPHLSPRNSSDSRTTRLLYESLIAGTNTPQSLPYLFRALRSIYSERADTPKFVSKPEVVREECESENGPDQCGHINTRTTYYKVYATHYHYDRFRPLAQKAAERLYWLAEQGLIGGENVTRVIEHAASQIDLGVDIVSKEDGRYDRYEVEGDAGYW